MTTVIYKDYLHQLHMIMCTMLANSFFRQIFLRSNHHNVLATVLLQDPDLYERLKVGSNVFSFGHQLGKGFSIDGTVDGWNIPQVDIENIPSFVGFHISQVMQGRSICS